MLAWIVLLIAAITGLLALLQTHADRLETLPGLPVAIAIIAGVSLLYLLTFRRSERESDRGSSRLALTLAVLAAGAAAIPALQSANLWPWPPLRHQPEARPSSPPLRSGGAAVRLRRSDGGRFSAQGEVNGAPIRLIIDTGAASVMLKASDAEAAGLDVRGLAFDTAIETANGATYVAPVRLRSVAIGGIRLDDVEAFVSKPGSLNESLLGMSFLKRLASYDLGGEFLTLRQ